MLTLQPAEWSKPRGFSHGVAVDGPGRWIVLAGAALLILILSLVLLGRLAWWRLTPDHGVELGRQL